MASPSRCKKELPMPEPIPIENAGLVLAGPFLPHLWSQLEMLTRDRVGKLLWKDRLSAVRAVRLLQLLIDGDTHAPEQSLALNRLMCGLPLEEPLPPGIEPTANELQACNALLEAIVADWTALDNTSVEGLRDTFLRRTGKLDRDPDGYRLTVQPRSFDMLLDRLPWSFSTIQQPWMPWPVITMWRE